MNIALTASMGAETTRILVVDDEPDQRDLLVALFAGVGWVAHGASSGVAALAALTVEPLPELIVIDLAMPGMDGLELLAQVRAGAHTAAIPVMVVSGHPDVDKRVESLEAGANDYVAKPVRGAELLARARNLLRTASQLEQLRRGSFLDPLTGLFNRVGLDHLLGLQTELAIRHHGQLAVLFLDLDGFKRVNDERGHAVGDRVLCEVARALEGQLRGSDFAARWGGDEFVAVLPAADPVHAGGVAARLEAAIAALAPSPDLPLGASVGFACLFEDVPIGDDTATRLIEAADQAMYRVKARHHAALGTTLVEPLPDRHAPSGKHIARSRAERRHGVRVPIDAPAFVTSRGGWRARVRNLSLGGLLLIGAPRLSLGEPVHAAIDIRGNPRLSISGTVVRHTIDARGQACHGVRFARMSAGGQDQLEELVVGALGHASGDAVLLVVLPRTERRAVAARLRRSGTHVVSAETAIRALSILDDRQVVVKTLVVTAELTQTSGLELAAYVAEVHPTIRRVVLADAGSHGLTDAVEAGGIHAVLDPPWTAERLLAEVRS